MEEEEEEEEEFEEEQWGSAVREEHHEENEHPLNKTPSKSRSCQVFPVLLQWSSETAAGVQQGVHGLRLTLSSNSSRAP